MENSAEWIYNTGALRHFCANKEHKQDFDDVADGECVYMGSSTIATVMDKERFFLNLVLANYCHLVMCCTCPSFVETLFMLYFSTKLD